MSETIYVGPDIKSAEIVTLFSERDFADLIEKHIGESARKYFEDTLMHEEIHRYDLRQAYDSGYADGYRDGLEESDF